MSEFKEESCPTIDEDPVKSDSSSGYASSTPTPSTPQSISPPHTLKRSRTASFRLINRRMSARQNSAQLLLATEPKDIIAAIIGWYPAFLIRMYWDLFAFFFLVFFKRLPFIIPSLWISTWMWVMKHLIFAFLSFVKNVLVVLLVPRPQRMNHLQKRTILISGGSTVQAIQLARNFASAGARVIMCEVEGYPSLGRFSTSVDQFYTIPKPEDYTLQKYLDTLKFIVVKEGAKYYIPVSEAHGAYYDACIKPYLEDMGCECICPNLNEVMLLDDISEVIRVAQGEGLTVPKCYPISNYIQLNRLYDIRIVKKERHFMIATNFQGCKKKQRVELPRSRTRLAMLPDVDDQNPWLVMQDYPGEKYVTCTTVKESQVVCNVTCQIDEIGKIVPVEKPEIEHWLRQFFAGLKAHRNIVGHVSFYFTIVPETKTLIPTDCHVGVRLPYVCYTSVQSRLLWKPCRHFSRHTSGPVVIEGGKYRLDEVAKNTWKDLSVAKVGEFLPLLWGKNDALFSWSDPLPFFVHYYVFLPMNKISNALNVLNSL